MCLDGRSDVEASLGGSSMGIFKSLAIPIGFCRESHIWEDAPIQRRCVCFLVTVSMQSCTFYIKSNKTCFSLSLSFTLQFIWPGLFSRYCKNKNYMRSPTPALFRTLFSLTATDEKKCGRRKRKCELVLGTKPNYTFQGCVTICARESIHCLTGFL